MSLNDDGGAQRTPEVLKRAIGEYALTPAEADVAARVVCGESNALICQARGVSPNTVKTQLRSIYASADVAGRCEFCADVLKRVLRLVRSS